MSEWTSLFPFIDELSPAGRKALISEATAQKISARTAFLHEGDPIRTLLLVQRGALRVFKVGPTGRQITLYRVRPGEVCVLSVSGMLAQATYPAEVETSEETLAHAVPASAFRRLFDSEPTLRRMVLEHNNRLLTGLMTLVAEVAFRKVDERLAAFLLAESAPDRPVVATHEQIASHLGTAREVVSRLLENFHDDGWVRVDRRAIAVLDRDALTAVVQ